MFDERLIRLAELQHAEHVAAAARERQVSEALSVGRPSPRQARRAGRFRGHLGSGLIALGCRLLATTSRTDTRCVPCQ